MRLLHLILIAALVGPAAAPVVARAQSSATPAPSQQLLDMARQIRADAERLKDSLTPEDRAEMLRQADEMEQEVRAGGYAPADAVRKAPPTFGERLLAEHDGRMEWLTATGACAGYNQESYTTYRDPAGSPEHHARCRRAYELWSVFTKVLVSGQGNAATEPALRAYDAAAREAYELSFRRR
jgi:hypothetical protein